ncbi:MAG: nucleotide exchange factor GrpE [Atopobiaceae bacterium]|nr:nucleotide exchange factor GrpE [Atopobiaceae bacterium]
MTNEDTQSTKVHIEVEGDAAEAAAPEAVEPDEVVEPEPEVEPNEDAMVAAAIAAGDAAADADFAADAAKLREERDDLARQLAEAQEQLEKANDAAVEATSQKLRMQADWDNYRKRTEAERVVERERAAERLVTNLLPVIDDMERAIAHAAGEAEANEGLKQFSDGVVAVRAKMLDILSHESVEMIDPAGEPFDPLAHQAVGRVENADVYEDTVADVYQKGYRMGGKVIRPAMVTVTFGGGKRPAPEE